MKAATVHELKKELTLRPAKELIELCTRLARFKKENKELLTYLLFEADDELAYTESIKSVLDEMFEAIPKSHSLHLKIKMLRKILRTANRYVRYTASKTAEVQVLLHFASTLKDSGIPMHRSTSLTNMYDNQLKKIRKSIETLHEDLQYDYLQELEMLIG